MKCWLIKYCLNTNESSPFVVKAVCFEKRRCRPAIRDGEAGKRKEPSHTRTEEDPQWGPVEVQQPPCPERQVPFAHAAGQRGLQRGTQGELFKGTSKLI